MYIGKPLQNGLSQKHKAEVMSIVSYLCKLFASYRWLVRSLGLFGPVPCSCELLFCWRLDPWFSVTLIPLLKVTPQFRNLIVFYVKRNLNHSGPYGRLEKTVTLPSVKMVSPKTPWFDGNASYYLSLVTDSLNDSIGMKASADNGCFPGSFTTLLPLYSLLTSLPWVKWCCGPYLPCFITVVYPDVLCEVRSRQSFMAQRFPSAPGSFPLTWPARGLSTWPWLNSVQYRPSKMPCLRWDINSRACLS